MTDETKQPWTPGPWTLGNENNYSCEVCLSVGDSELVISLGRQDTLTGRECVNSREEMLSNAHLVISAPAMAEALAKLVAEYEEDAKYDIDGVLRCDWKTRKVVDSPEIADARAALNLCGWQWGGR